MTRLKALELFGFKSFADRTRFEFPEGITVVVGPNGSGKSNVVDAIKWVLGEQSMRSLRGRDTTDVIFAGSVSRKPLNAAEVSLIFDNAARDLPVESPEVQITRRVYRSGESEYLVNGTASRLRDIRELFSGTGAATEAYSVIEQGRVDALLVASGRDRRAVFEEAAGITRFRSRRAEALRRLERAEQNRQRLADIVGEVAARLETVKHQAARARRWRTMTDTLRAFRLAAAREDLAAVDADVARVEAALAEARRRHADAEAAATAAALAVDAFAEQERGMLPRLAECQATTTAACERAAVAEARVTILRNRRREVDDEAARADAGLAAARNAAREVERRIAAARADVAAIQAEADALAAAQQAHEQAAAGSHDDAASLRRALDTRADALTALQQARIRLQSEVDRAAARVGECRRAIDAGHVRADAAQATLARVLEAAATWEGNLAALTLALDTIAAEIEALERRRAERSAQLDAAWQSLASCTARLEACQERRAVLADMVSRHEGLTDAARALLATAPPPGLAGALADTLVADEPWARLVDLALGAHGQALVVESLDGLLASDGDWLSADATRSALAAGGRVTFLAPAAVRDPPDFEPVDIAGVVERLDRLIPVAAPDHSRDRLAHSLLGRVWVVETLAAARAVVAVAPPGVMAITREGTILSADGVLELGVPAAAAGLISRRSELRGLEEKHLELRRSAEERKAAVDALQAELATVQDEIRQAVARRQQAAEQVAASRAELARTGREERQARMNVSEAEAVVREAERAAIEAGVARDTAAAALAAHDTELGSAAAALTAARADLEAADRSRGAVIEALARLRGERGLCEARLAGARDAAAALLGDAAVRRADTERARQQRADAEARRAVLDLDLLAAEAAHAEAAIAAETARVALTAVVAERDIAVAAVQAHTAAAGEARAAISGWSERIHAHDLEAGEGRHRRSRIIERIRDDYDVVIDETTLPVACDADGAPIEVPSDRAELDRRIEELRRKLASMTTVNMEALAEAETLAERLQTLEAQLADVTGGKQAIEQLIARIDDESRRLLGDTIETVRGHFRELFERVFGGGQADIVLDPELDLLETSVEIVARPPGKEPRSISLLSGGEKTMTCVALLLAIFRSRPSPFCVLDEVDAALDEANVDRFVGVLRDFLSSTQFIIVTHSKKTMAAATTLYGVTMEESGVSKRVSVRFESTAAAAGTPAAKAA
jgi:chromosome segregation protein